MAKLSALVCAHNEEAALSACLRSLNFCDEIVVVADRCTDGSQQVARRHGAIVVDGIFPLASQRKTAGLEACSGDWILEVDANEQVGSALAWEIRALLRMRSDADAFEIPVDNYVGRDLVREGWTGTLSSRRALRLFRPEAKAWSPRRLDEGRVRDGFAVGALKGALQRTVARDAADLLDRVRRLAALRAEDLADAGQIDDAAGEPTEALRAFAGSYVARAGWREGHLGLLVAVLSALYPLVCRQQMEDTLRTRARLRGEAERAARYRRVARLAV